MENFFNSNKTTSTPLPEAEADKNVNTLFPSSVNTSSNRGDSPALAQETHTFQAAEYQPDTVFKNALSAADGNQFNIAGAENRVNPRYRPEKTEELHDIQAFSANEGIQHPAYGQTNIDHSTKKLMAEHFLEGNQSALNHGLYQEAMRHPGARFPAIAITSASLGSAETMENIAQGAYEGVVQDPLPQSIDPLNYNAPMDKSAFPKKALDLDTFKKPLKKTLQSLQAHPDFRDSAGKLTALGHIASLTGDIAHAAPGTALTLLGGPAVRAIILGSSSKAVHQNAYDAKMKELSLMSVSDILRDREYEGHYQRLIAKHGSRKKAEKKIRHEIASGYASEVRNIHGILTVGGRIAAGQTNHLANTAFSRYLRNISLASLVKMAPQKVVNRIHQMDEDNKRNEAALK